MFKNRLISQPIFQKILEFQTENPTYNVWVVGGFVRDLLLNETSKDIDLVITLKSQTIVEKVGIQFAQDLSKFLGLEKEVGYFPNFGTANFVYKGIEIETVGARKESYDRGSRKPIVEDGTLDDDLSRRDFTFNAMAISLNVEDFGDIVDKFDGINDLNNGIIRTPLDPDITFSDDPLRMLRAIRFASRFGFKIEDQTYKALARNAKRLEIISQERIVQEMNKILVSKVPSVGLLKLQETGMLKIFLPEVSNLDDVQERDGKRHKNNWLHTAKVVDQTREMTDDVVLLWAALLHDMGKIKARRFNEYGWSFHDHEEIGSKMLKGVMTRLKLPVTEWYDKINAIVKYHGRLKALVPDDSGIVISDSAIRRIVVETGSFLDDLLLFVRCDITTRQLEKKTKYLTGYDRLADRILEVVENDNLRNFKVPIGGEEIMKVFNLGPSVQIKQIKDAIKEAILSGEIPNTEEAAREFMFKISKTILA